VLGLTQIDSPARTVMDAERRYDPIIGTGIVLGVGSNDPTDHGTKEKAQDKPRE